MIQGEGAYEGHHTQEAQANDAAQSPRSRRIAIPCDEDQRGKGVLGEEWLKDDSAWKEPVME